MKDDMLKMTKINSKRCKDIGDTGEGLAFEIFEKNNFKNIKNLNEIKSNFPFADIYAERDNKKYIVSVKSRNKFELNGNLNSRYKLDKNCNMQAVILSKQFKAIPAFLAIQMDNDNGTYSAYFGELHILNGNKAILMGDKYLSRYECLAKDTKSDFDCRNLKNVYNEDEDVPEFNFID